MHQRFSPMICIALLVALCVPLLAQPSSNALEFAIQPDEDRRTLFGALVFEEQSWNVYSVALTVHSLNADDRSCRVTLWGQGQMKQQRRELREGRRQDFRLIPGHPPITIEVSQVTRQACQGHVIVTSDTANSWRRLSAGSPATSQAALDAFQIGAEGVQAPSLTHRTSPSYTDEAKRAGIGGTSLFQVVIDENGMVDPNRIHIIRTLGYGLDEAAMEAIVNNWEFEPGTHKGQPAPVMVVVEVSFTLRR
ncbi:MAG TPA: energy transducer TonB [Acidobacteriota bacterium]|nr:energy transducer TonB [Acidobacteriota bacterium]